MSDTPKRRYNKISPEHLAYARKRFAEFASTSAVRAELKAMGADYPHNALAYYWHQAAKKRKAALATMAAIDQEIASADPDPADEARAA